MFIEVIPSNCTLTGLNSTVDSDVFLFDTFALLRANARVQGRAWRIAFAVSVNLVDIRALTGVKDNTRLCALSKR